MHDQFSPLPDKRARSSTSVAFRQRVALILAGLLALFVFRVAAQFAQRFWEIGFLPAFDAWHSGVLPYWLLYGFQIIIGLGFAVVTWQVATDRTQPKAAVGAFLLSFGALYFGVMLFRLGGALGPGSGGGFFASKAIPVVFHLVLSSWLITLGLYHAHAARTTGDAAPDVGATLVHWLAYPVLIACCLLLRLLLLGAGLGLQTSSYVPVAIGALVITVLERRFPHRREWQPNREEVANDLTFMVLVQILLPKFLSFLTAVTILRFLQSHDIALRGFWPHDLPPFAQAVLMLLGADFLRYWLHRLSHEWSPLLWRFHAVHHSPPKLYWVNVGRFHPIEKSVQFLCDAAPFILVGVSESVLSLYFVFYAVNGFFQHCNIELRLGLLNFVISGPELHRWHHSREEREANHNYGNNVIIWDLLFGSYFLPKHQAVGTLGLRNRAYPPGFFHQMRTPFIRGIDREQK